MYPLNVILVGCDNSLSPAIRAELTDQLAVVEAECPEVESLIQGYKASKDEVRLLMIHVRSSREIQELKRASGTFVGWPIIALVDAGMDHMLLISANRAGANQVVPLPLRGLDLKDALDSLSLHNGRRAGGAKMVILSSVTGGAGATTTAINLTYELSKQHALKCILVELSLRMGMVSTCLDIEPKYTVQDLLNSRDRLDIHAVRNALTPFSERFEILAGSLQTQPSMELAAQDLMQIVNYTRRLADCVVVDLPCGYDDRYFEMLCSADQVVLVAEQKVPSIRALKLVRDGLEPYRGTTTPHILINRYDPRIKGFTITELRKHLKAPRLLTVANDYASVSASVNNGRPLREEAPRSPVVHDIATLAHVVLGLEGEMPVRNGKGSVLGRLVRAFGLG